MANTSKLPPNNNEAECAVLGSILMSEEALDEVLEILKPHDFYNASHQRIYSAILKLSEAKQNVDIITVTDQLRRTNDLEASGGAVYLSDVVEGIPSAANVVYYANIVKDRSSRRALIHLTTGLTIKGYEGEPETKDLLDEAERRIFEINSQKERQQAVLIKTTLKDTIETIEALGKKGQHITGISTGFYHLDRITSGLQPSNLIIIGARTSVGKTAFAMAIAQHAAVVGKVPTVLYSLEMSVKEVTQRLLASESRVELGGIRHGFVRKEDWPKLTGGAARLAAAPFLIDESPALTPMELRSKVRRLKSAHKIGLVVIDYLQLMRYPGKSDSRQQEISEISRSIKALAREMDIPIIALSQLSRKADEMSDRKDHSKRPPELSHLRESGAIEQDADLVMLLHRPEMDGAVPGETGKMQVLVKKHRNGPLGDVHLRFFGQYMRFEDEASAG
ncbi:MAG: replicative DNA helicase [Candidatus Omnitrophica bacterium]|nr:replicative DNA helicase [Candidatus Omnitrophota bacterium]